MPRQVTYLSIVFLTVFANLAFADGITTSATCQSATMSGSSTSSCQAGTAWTPEGYASATVSANASLQYMFGSASISASASALSGYNPQPPANSIGITGEATADINFTLTPPTNLIPQAAYLVITPENLSFSSNEDMQVGETLTFGGFYQQNCGMNGFNSYGFPACVPPSVNLPPTFYSGEATIIPMEIGNPYTFDFTATAKAMDGDWDYPSGTVTGTIDYNIVLASAPEPATFALIGAPLIAIALLRRRSRAMTRREV